MGLSKKEIQLIPSSYDVVGDVLIFADFPDKSKKNEKFIGDYILKRHRNIKVVCKKIKKYSGKYRLPKLKIIAGEKRKETTYKENKCIFDLDCENVYFSPRLATERLRIAKLVKKNESILVMFSGCAPFICVIGKNSEPKEIYGIEVNPTAHKYAIKNIIKNKLKNVVLVKGDVKKVIPKMKKKFDRVVMPLPKGAENFLNLALKVSKKNSMIHFYDFLHENNFYLANEKIKKACKKSRKKYKILRIVKCGQFAPHVFRICVDFKVI